MCLQTWGVGALGKGVWGTMTLPTPLVLRGKFLVRGVIFGHVPGRSSTPAPLK